MTDPKDIWVHIPTPGDHYSPRTGSAVITVIQQMCLHHTGPSKVIVQRDTMDGYDTGERVEIDFPQLGTPPAWKKAVDRGVGVLSSRRLLSGSAYRAAALAIGAEFDGVVFIHNEPAGVEVVARRCPRARVVLWVQNELFRTYTPGQVRRVIEQSHRVICCSNFIRSGIVSIAGENAKLFTVLNGVDTKLFHPAEARACRDQAVVLFVGRLVPQKGVDVLLQAARELVNRGKCFRLRVVGSAGFTRDGPLSEYEKRLRQLAESISGIVEFIPFQDRSEIAKQYREADVLCVPSRWPDPCPLTALEGLASGLPCVFTDRGGLPELAGESALVVEGGNPTALTDALDQVLFDNELRHRMIACALLGNADRDWSVVCEYARKAIGE